MHLEGQLEKMTEKWQGNKLSLNFVFYTICPQHAVQISKKCEKCLCHKFLFSSSVTKRFPSLS